MLDLRSPLILAAPPAGLLAGALLWVALSGVASPVRPLGGIETRLAAARLGTAGRAVAGPDPVAQAVAAPVFGKIMTPSIRLIGISRSASRVAALVSIDGGAPEWLERGATKSGLTLLDVRSIRIVIDSLTGPREIGLWDKPPKPASPPGAGAQPAPTGG